MRKHLTTFFWYHDQLCSLSTPQLLALNAGCLAALIVVASQALEFFDALTFLLADPEALSFSALLGLVLLSGAALWLFSISLATLWQRLALYRRKRR